MNIKNIFSIALFVALFALNGCSSNNNKGIEMENKTSKTSKMLYQVGTINSLLAGVYEGDVFFEDLTNYGDFGLGTFDAVNGEMIALDDDYYRIDAEGKAHLVASKMKTPFAVVTNFQEEIIYDIGSFDDVASLQKYISTKFESENIIYAISIDGYFNELNVRSEHPQPKGHHPLSETIAKVQNAYTLNNTKGTIVGFWFPKYMKAINVPGFHFHFIDDARTKGGHLFDMRIDSGTLKIMPIFDFGMHLIHTPLFEHANIENDFKSATKKVEHR